MLRNRVLILLGGCLLMGSAAVADELGFVDCATHPEEQQVFAKARKSQDVVGTIPCGERFKIVLYGFIFSEVQTSDGKVGFVYSSVITVDRAGGTLQSRAATDVTPRLSAASETTKIPADPRTSAAPAQARRPAAPVTSSTTADTMCGANSVAAPPASVANAEPTPAAPVTAAQPQAPATPATFADGANVLKATEGASALPAAAPAATPSSVEPAQAQPTQPDPATAPAATPAPADANAAPAVAAATTSATPATAASTTDSAATTTNATVAVPAPVVSEPAPVPAPASASRPQPAPPAVQPGVENSKIKTESWEKPNPGGRNMSLIELFGGFSFARMNNGGGAAATNFLGGLGSFAFNIKPWIQISGDSSYNYYSVTGTKYVMYGNHYGPRFFYRRHNRFGVTPFAEALFGGSRVDTTITGTGGYTTSTNGFSWKVGGGVDMRASRLFEIRLIDVDYYRTSFGTNATQTNYWISTGVVLRLFRGWSD